MLRTGACESSLAFLLPAMSLLPGPFGTARLAGSPEPSPAPEMLATAPPHFLVRLAVRCCARTSEAGAWRASRVGERALARRSSARTRQLGAAGAADGSRSSSGDGKGARGGSDGSDGEAGRQHPMLVGVLVRGARALRGGARSSRGAGVASGSPPVRHVLWRGPWAPGGRARGRSNALVVYTRLARGRG